MRPLEPGLHSLVHKKGPAGVRGRSVVLKYGLSGDSISPCAQSEVSRVLGLRTCTMRFRSLADYLLLPSFAFS